MFQAASALACALLLSVAGCSKADPNAVGTSGTDRERPPTTVRRNAQTLSALASFGDNGTLLVVVRPSAWPKIRNVLMPLLSGIDFPPTMDLEQAESPDELAGLVLALFDISTERVPRIVGWDIERPITASLFEAGLGGPVGSLTPALIGEAPPPTIRHQVLVPATDTAALVRSLARLAEAAGTPWPDVVDGMPGAKAVRVGGFAVAIVPEQHQVRIVLAHPIASKNDLATVRARLATTAVDLPTSAPTQLLIARDNFVSTLVRPWRARELNAVLGARLVRAALESSSDTQATRRAHGARLLLLSELAMSDASADFDQSALALRVDGAVIHFRMVSRLTEHGAAVADAMRTGAGGPFTTKAPTPWLEAFVGANLSGLVNVATAPPGLLDWRQGEQRLRESRLARLYAGLRFPSGLLKLLHQAVASEQLPFPLDKLPVATQLVWTGTQDGELPSGALAFEWPEGANTSAVTSLVSLARTDPTYAGLSVSKLDRGGNPVTMVGSGIDATAVIHGSGTIETDALATLHAEFSPIAAALEATSPHLARGLAVLGELDARWTRVAHAIVLDAALSPKGVRAVASMGNAKTSEKSPPPRAPSNARGQRCLSMAGLAVADGLRALTTVGSDSLGAISARAIAVADPRFRCAASFSPSKAAATALRRMHATLAADVMIEKRRIASAAMVLGAECAATKDPAICARSRALAVLPAPQPPALNLPTSCVTRGNKPRPRALISIDRRGIGVLDELVTATSLAAHVGTERLALPAPVELSIDRDTTMATVRPVLEVLRVAGLDHVLFSVTEDGVRRAIAVRLLDTAPASGENWSEAPQDATWSEVIDALAGGCPGPSLVVREPS